MLGFQVQASTITSNSLWSKPTLGVVNCNIDVSFFHDSRKMGFGCCLRDDRDSFIQPHTGWLDSMMEVQEGEAFALLAALR